MRHVMGPFGDEEDAEFGDVVDGEVTGEVHKVTGAPGVTRVPIGPDSPPPVDPYHYTPDPYTPADAGQRVLAPEVADRILQLATDKRSRAIALFAEIPFLAYVAFSDDVAGPIRLMAAGLGLMRVIEVAQRQQELEQYLPEMP